MNEKRLCLVVQGAEDATKVPGLAALDGEVTLRFANDAAALRAALAGADVLLGCNFRASLREAWPAADRLRWIHWSGAGVDALLFPDLVASDVVLTNARGVFDRAMAEYVLGTILAFAKDLPRTLELQREHAWEHRLTERIAGRRVLVVGVGSIGREIARVLGAVGMHVEGVGRTARAGDADFASIHAVADLGRRLGAADYVVLVPPLTEKTRGMIGEAELRAMRPHARLINVGRGALLDERALARALERGTIAGAALDVFETEPLPADSPLWETPGLLVSPHMSGDFHGYPEALAELFLDNLRRFRAGEALRNVVDKSLGFVPS